MTDRSFKGRDFLDLADYTAEELSHVLDVAIDLKARTKAGACPALLSGRTLGMIFQKPSNRTRVSFEVGMYQLGGHALYLSPAEIQLGVRETVRDVAQVLSRYLDAIMIRAYSHADVVELAEHASIPVVNGLDDLYHPCQAVADILTIAEHCGGMAALSGLNVTYVGDGNNVLHSLAQATARLGMHLTAAVPVGYEPDAGIWQAASGEAGRHGGSLALTHDPREAVRGARVLYTDVWTSMGQEDEREKRLADFQGFQVNAELLAAAGPETLIMHCLPAHYGEEITADAAYSPRSVVFDQAENRLHAQKAVLSLLVAR